LCARLELQKENVATPYEVQEAKAAVADARANYVIAKKNLADTIVYAPYSGRVVKNLIDAQELSKPGEEILEVIDDHVLIGRLLLPSNRIKEAKIGLPVKVFVEDANKVYQGKIVRISAKVDPTSSMIPVEIEMENTNQELLTGMTGWVTLQSDTGN
ncbi:MAG: HlyD family secretion protein, partial [Chlamydiia bacterium]|nr:HlyD family secretion protein [Chlamydiia bacterium]